MKRITTVLIAFLLVLTSALTFSNVNAAGGTYDSLGVIKDVKLWATLGEETNEIIDTSIVSSASTITMDFHFHLEDGVDYRGKTTSFLLPSIFQESSILADLDIVLDGVVIGKLRKVPGTSTVNLVFTDTDYLVNNSNIKGIFKVNAKFEKSKIPESNRYPIEFGDIYKKDVYIYLEPDWGHPDTIYVWKHGEIKPTEGIVTWIITVPIFQDVTNVVIKDTHSEGQIVDYSSFEAQIVYSHDGTPNLPLDLKIDKTSVNSFSIDLGTLYYEGSKNNGKPVSSEVHAEKRDAVLMRYNTIITEDHNFYRNRAEITANEVDELRAWDETVKNISGGIVGETRSINIIKYDKDTNEGLSGAVFNLEKLNSSTNEWYTFKENIEILNISGLQVDKLTFGTYRLVETKAPIGYILNSTPSERFTIDASISETLEIKIPNEQMIFEILVKKVDANTNEELDGALFSIHDKFGNIIIDNFTSNKKIALEPGNYELHERKAPIGYELNLTPINFTVEFSQTETQILTVKNKKIVNKYTVTYESLEHEEGMPPVDSNEYEEKDIVVLKDATMTRPGYTFVGWAYEGKILTQGSNFEMPAKDVVFVAMWEEDKVPTDPDPTDPTDPDPTGPNPTDPNPTDPTDPTNPDNPNEEELPKTGVMSWQPLAYLMILMGAAILIVFKRKVKTK